ncbi:MAG: ATPase, T2SS/T4P/T4SS family [Candidatus Hadarchaeales archaeon]
MAQRLALDKVMYGWSDEKKCKKCVEERMRALTEMLDHLIANPHEFQNLRTLLVKAQKEAKGDCKGCTAYNFGKLVGTIEKMFGHPVLKKLKPGKYDEAFAAIQKPFFVEGVWISPPPGSKLVEEYPLKDDRGKVRIYERPENPVLFYELDLPEFKIPQEHLRLLYRAFSMQVETAPPHARFAYSERMQSFAEEWYDVILHMLKEEGQRISAVELHKMARLMAGWLTYRVLEPLSHDDFITDIYISAPPELQPVVVEHERWGKMETGIRWDTPSLLGLGETLASRLGTSFDEVRPQLDAEIPELGMRLFLSRYPAIWRKSVEIAVRKRRSKPWTQPLFLERGTLTPLASAFLGTVLRLGASAFVIGEMGTAKTSQVETYIPEIGPENRIVAFQDTEELHIEDFIAEGYKIANVRVANPEHLEQQVNAFLRGGASYWLITEVRAAEAVRAALGAAARQGSQPVVASFHARSKREMFDLVTHIMGLHEAAFKYVDYIISTARFSTPRGTIRRIVEVAEVLKEWEGKPKYVEMFVDDRKRDIILQKNLLRGKKEIVGRLNGRDLSKIDPKRALRGVEILPPEKGGSELIPALCRRLGIDEDELLESMLCEAFMKSDLLALARKSGNAGFLELPFVSRAYNVYSSMVKRHRPDFLGALREWRTWLKRL